MLQTEIIDSTSQAAAEVSTFKYMSLEDFIDKITNSMVTFAINLAIAVLVFYVGKFVINRLYRLVSGMMNRRNVDTTLTTFVLSMIRIVLYFILIVTVIGILGIETSSFLALRDKLHKSALRFLKNDEDARDALQDTFFNLWRNGTVETEAEARSKLFVVLRNICIDRLRKPQILS